MTVSVDRLKQEYDQGATLRDIGARYGLSHQAVHQRLRYHGVELRLRRIYAQRACTQCGALFQPTREDHRYCSSQCYGDARKDVHQERCYKGHLMTPENLTPRYGRKPPHCRQCARERQKRYLDRKRGVL